MSASPISPKVISLLEKISQLTAEEVLEVEHFIEFLLTKKERTLYHSNIISDNTKSTSHTDTISEFIASFPASPISQAHTSQEFSDSLFPHSSFDFSEKEEEQKNSMIKQVAPVDKNQVIIAPEEPVPKKSPSDIDFTDINARFARERDKKNKENREEPKKVTSKGIDWL
ncbi:MAG: DUF2281 domain-containing protein [Methanomicrobiales archaeon]|jgi:hypothetical protein|nr:DUF2281 domain-containing protein [Methanomicrobiales archaeon]